MMAEVKVERSRTAIMEALRDCASDEAELFATEYREALIRAAATFDLSESERVLNRWWGIAYLRLNPPTEHERDLVRRLYAGEDVGWSTPEEYLASLTTGSLACSTYPTDPTAATTQEVAQLQSCQR